MKYKIIQGTSDDQDLKRIFAYAHCTYSHKDKLVPSHTLDRQTLETTNSRQANTRQTNPRHDKL